jgi:hypothetical protein
VGRFESLLNLKTGGLGRQNLVYVFRRQSPTAYNEKLDKQFFVRNRLKN